MQKQKFKFLSTQVYSFAAGVEVDGYLSDEGILHLPVSLMTVVGGTKVASPKASTPSPVSETVEAATETAAPASKPKGRGAAAAKPATEAPAASGVSEAAIIDILTKVDTADVSPEAAQKEFLALSPSHKKQLDEIWTLFLKDDKNTPEAIAKMVLEAVNGAAAPTTTVRGRAAAAAKPAEPTPAATDPDEWAEYGEVVEDLKTLKVGDKVNVWLDSPICEGDDIAFWPASVSGMRGGVKFKFDSDGAEIGADEEGVGEVRMIA